MNQQPTDAAVPALVTKITWNGNTNAHPADWLVQTMMSGSAFPGFVSAEILPPDNPASKEWALVQRFRTRNQVDAWKDSEQQLALLAELDNAPGNHTTQEVQEQFGSRGAVTTAIVTHVIPGREADYRDWERRIQTAQARFPGYQGSYLQPPTGISGMWVTLLRFDTPESLDHWFGSEQRSELLKEGQQLIKSTDIRRVGSSFPGWVPIDETSGKSPPNWKTAILVLLGLYPIVMLELRYIAPMLSFLPPALSNLVTMMISVCGTTYITMPFFIKTFRRWLFNTDKKAEWKWLALFVAIHAIEVLLLGKLP